MNRFLPAAGCRSELADSLGDEVRAAGRVTLQPPGAPAVRMLEVGSDLALLARAGGGPAWPALSTRWRTDLAAERLAPLAGGHLIATGTWEPVAGQPLRASIHVNSVSALGAPRPLAGQYSAYLSLLASGAVERPAPEPRLIPVSGPTPAALDQCLLRVIGRVADTYTVSNDVTGEPVRILWLSAPGAWALQVAVAPHMVTDPCERGAWVEAFGLLQGDLVAGRD